MVIVRRMAALAIAVVAMCYATIVGAAEIRFRTQAQAKSDVVRLGDVAEIITVDPRERELLRAVEIGPSGPVRQTLPAREVQERLSALGVNLVDHQFAGAAVITVSPDTDQARSGGRPLSKSAINLANSAVANAAVAQLKRTADPDEDWTVEVELTPEQAQAVGSHRRSITVTGGEAPWTGAQTFKVNVPSQIGGELFTVEAEVRRAPRAVVAVNAIARGDTIRAQDVELARLKAGSQPRMAFQSLEETIGKEAMRNIVPGQVLDDQYVRSPLLVKRGDVVDVFARSGGVQVRTRGRAKVDGSHGDLIQVEMLTDRKALLARVCGMQEVEVLAAGPVVSK